MDETWVTCRRAAEALGWARNEGEEISRLIKRGEVAAEKFNGRWWISPAELDRLASIHHGFASFESAGRLVRQLKDRIAALEQEQRDGIRAAAAAEQMSARRALRILSLEECLEILGRIDVQLVTTPRRDVYEARRRVQEQLDRRDHQGALGARPAGVPERATSRRLGTGIGPIDIWLWPTPKGWNARHGGPRPGSRYGPHRDRRGVLRDAARQARSTFGKPVRATSIRLRFLILERDAFTCRYCGRKAPDVELAVDHAVSLADGGLDHEDNLVTACRDCNAGKSGRSVPIA